MKILMDVVDNGRVDEQITNFVFDISNLPETNGVQYIRHEEADY